MFKRSGLGTRSVRNYNELNLLRFIKDFGPLSRAQLSKRYQISKATVSEITAELIKNGFIHEIGVGKSSKMGGRKPILLEFNPKSGFTIGIEIKRDHARIALTDLNAHIYELDEISFPAKTSLKTILDDLSYIIEDFLKIPWIENSVPIGIGVSIPGLIDYKHGCILESDSHKDWEGVLICKTFEEKFNIQTFLENDVKAMTFGEFRFGNGKNYNNMVYLWIGDGIGAGIVINGQLYRGITASAGEVGYYEIGHQIRDCNEFKWIYNGHKNFGDILHDDVLLTGAKKAIDNKIITELEFHSLTIEKILNHAQKGDELSIELIREYSAVVGILSINLINTLNPEILLIAGENLAYSPMVLKYIKQRIKKDALHTPILAVRVQNAGLKENAAVLGSVGLVLDDIFYSNDLNLERYRALFN